MSKQRATFGKRERERDKQAKAAAKRERRASRGENEASAPEPSTRHDQEAVLADLARLHEAYEDGGVGLEDFESRRDELRARLQVD